MKEIIKQHKFSWIVVICSVLILLIGISRSIVIRENGPDIVYKPGMKIENRDNRSYKVGKSRRLRT